MIRTATIPAADWDAFEAWTSAPGKAVPALKELATYRAQWRDGCVARQIVRS